MIISKICKKRKAQSRLPDVWLVVSKVILRISSLQIKNIYMFLTANIIWKFHDMKMVFFPILWKRRILIVSDIIEDAIALIFNVYKEYLYLKQNNNNNNNNKQNKQTNKQQTNKQKRPLTFQETWTVWRLSVWCIL